MRQVNEHNAKIITEVLEGRYSELTAQLDASPRDLKLYNKRRILGLAIKEFSIKRFKNK